MRHLRLTPDFLPMDGTPVSVQLTVGLLYELRCDVGVMVHAASPRSPGIPVRPDTPLVFVADADRMFVVGPLGAEVVVRAEWTATDDTATAQANAATALSTC